MLRSVFALTISLSITIIGLVFTHSVASAAPQCDTRASVISVLQEKYKESPVAIGVTHSGSIIEVLTTNDGSTWSIIVTTPQGIACLVAAGDGWQSMTTPIPGSDS